MWCPNCEGSGKCPGDKGEFCFSRGNRTHHDTKVRDGRAAIQTGTGI